MDFEKKYHPEDNLRSSSSLIPITPELAGELQLDIAAEFQASLAQQEANSTVPVNYLLGQPPQSERITSLFQGINSIIAERSVVYPVLVDQGLTRHIAIGLQHPHLQLQSPKRILNNGINVKLSVEDQHLFKRTFDHTVETLVRMYHLRSLVKGLEGNPDRRDIFDFQTMRNLNKGEIEGLLERVQPSIQRSHDILYMISHGIPSNIIQSYLLKRDSHPDNSPPIIHFSNRRQDSHLWIIPEGTDLAKDYEFLSGKYAKPVLGIAGLATLLASCASGLSTQPINLEPTPIPVNPEPDSGNGNGQPDNDQSDGSSTAIPNQEATPSPSPPGNEVSYPDNSIGFLWDQTNSSSDAIKILEDENSVYYNTTNNIEKFYNNVAGNQGFSKENIDFVGSIGPDTWVVAVKYQDNFYLLKEKDGLLLSEITPFNIYNDDPAKYILVEVSLPEGYSDDDIRLVQDEVSTYHLFATSDKQFYLDLTEDKWKAAANVEIIPTDSANNFEVANWAEKDGKIDPDYLYPLIGEVNHINKKTIDLQYNGMNIAIQTNEDVSKMDNLAEFKGQQAALINNNLELKSQLDLIKQQVNESNTFTIVVNNGQITQIIESDRINGNILSRYFWENGSFRQMTKEEEPLLMAPLSAPDHRFIRTDTGEQVMIRGGNFVQLSWAPEAIYINQLDSILHGMKEMGSNYVVFQWNSGYLDNPDYLNKLISTLKLAKFKYGFRVQLDLATRGIEEPNNPYSRLQISTVDSKITDDWKKLLNNSENAFWIGRTVDIFTVISEPTHNIQGQNNPSFFDPVLSETADVIRSSINNSKAIIGYSAGRWGWAGDADELLGHDRLELGAEITINIHPYRYSGYGAGELIGKDTRSDPKDYVTKLQEAGWNISVGEYGWFDIVNDPEYTKEMLRFFEDNKISYTLSGTTGGYNTITPGDESNLFIDYDGQQISPYGQFIKDFWSSVKED